MDIPFFEMLGSIGSALIGGYSASQAAKEQARAVKHAADVQRKNYQDTQQMLQPQIAAGDTARSYQLGALGLPGEVGHGDVMSTFRTSPGYEFARNQGLNAIQTSAAAGGSLFSGKTLKSLAQYGQGLADQEFGNWFNRLGGLAGGGAGATGQLASAGEGTARTLGDLAMREGDARASSYVGQANAITGGVQNLSDLYHYYNPPGARVTAGTLSRVGSGGIPIPGSNPFLTRG